MNLSTSAKHPVLALLTDFGLSDGYAGVMKGIILGIVPHAQIIDITHAIAPQDIAAGAWILAVNYRYFPTGTTFVCVVDPGVGSTRRPLALRAGEWVFVGPDNGLFSYILSEQPLHEVVVLSRAAYHLPRVSSTFHGRDIFSPVAAHIAAGRTLSEVGEPVDPMTVQRLTLATAHHEGERVKGQIIHRDHFGNLVTNIPLDLVPDLFENTVARLHFPDRDILLNEHRRFFAGESATEGRQEPFFYADSAGYVGVAIRNGNAAESLGIDVGTPVVLLLT